MSAMLREGGQDPMTADITPEKLWKDIDIRITDQRIGMGVGGMDTILRMQHLPSGIVVEIPRNNRSQHTNRQIAFDMISLAMGQLK
jgi:protein subunit release factor A